jgi:hypothetical protein
MTDALQTELATLTAEIAAFDAARTGQERDEPAEMTAKRNRASEIVFELS